MTVKLSEEQKFNLTLKKLGSVSIFQKPRQEAQVFFYNVKYKLHPGEFRQTEDAFPSAYQSVKYSRRNQGEHVLLNAKHQKAWELPVRQEYRECCVTHSRTMKLSMA